METRDLTVTSSVANPAVLTDRQRRFAELYAAQGNATEAYLCAGFASSSRQVAQRSASRLRRHPAVAAYLKHLHRIALSALTDSDTILPITRKLAFLARVVNTSAADPEKARPLSTYCRQYADGSLALRLPCKLRALILHSQYTAVLADLQAQRAPLVPPPPADRKPLEELPAAAKSNPPLDLSSLSSLPSGAGLYTPPPSQISDTPTTQPPPPDPAVDAPPPPTPLVAHRRAVLAELAKPAPPPWETNVLQLAPELYNCRPNGKKRVTVIR